MKKYSFLIKTLIKSSITASILASIIIMLFWVEPINSMVYLDDVKINELTSLRINNENDLNKFSEILSRLPGNVSRSGGGISWSKFGSIQVSYDYHGSDKLSFKKVENFWRKNKEKILIFNSTAYLILVPSAKEITIELNIPYKQKFKVTRTDLEKFYKRDLNEFYLDTGLWEKEVVKETINSRERLKAFFRIHEIEQME